MTSAGPCGGLVALQSLALLHGGWAGALYSSGPSLFGRLSAREEKINVFLYFYLCVDTGSWCVGRYGDAFMTYKSAVLCGGSAGPC